MVQIARWKIFLILAVCLFGFVYSSPNFVPGLATDNPVSGFVPHKTVNLGLDLRGGAHLLYEADLAKVFKERVDGLESDIVTYSKDMDVVGRDFIIKKRGLSLKVSDAEKANKLKAHIRGIDRNLYVETASDGETINITMDDNYIKSVEDQTIALVIEVVRRRIDEMGTTEPVIQRQGSNRIVVQVPGASSQDVKNLIGKTAKLGFHLVGKPGGRSIRDIVLPYAEDPSRDLNVKKNAIVTGQMLTNAQPSFGQSGEPVVSFRLNTIGSKKFCDVTRKNVGKPFAIVLDNEIISAPRINEAICGGNGQISGGFAVKEAQDLALLLRAGALPTDLEVVEERTVGPSLGADSVAAGKIASILGLVLVLIFMVISYGLFGLMANVALVVNIALILAVLSSLQATLTLPGIAGIVLTVGMAVDANVLIFERIREELAAGRTAISSIDAGYSRAMSTIVDSNLTTLIAAIILFSFGTGPIKGFAVTLGIGIMTSFFSAIMVTRLLVVLWLQKVKPKTVPI